MARGFTDLNDRASHPAGLVHSEAFDVFAKVGERDQLASELEGLKLLHRLAKVTTATPIADGLVDTEHGAILMLEAIDEIPAEQRTTEHWQDLGHALASVHQVHGERFGLADFDGYFGPLHQDNRQADTWAEFYAERRLRPLLHQAGLPHELTKSTEHLIDRLPTITGSEPRPTLLHGDAQQNNLLTTPEGAALIDPAPYFGHPELDLALVDYFAPVPQALFDAYRERAPQLDQGFAGRRELWRIFAYLAVIAVDGASPFGKAFLTRLENAVALYR